MSGTAVLPAGERRQAIPAGDWLALAAALVLSALLVAMVADEPLAAAAFLGGAAVLAVPLRAWLRRPASADAAVEAGESDWTVTRAAIDRPGAAVAITDLAGRLVCASAAFEEWFGTAPPPRLPLDGSAQARLEQLARDAWRDGEAAAEALEGAGGCWRAEARRCGRGEDHLVWTFVPAAAPDLVAEACAALSGRIGALLGAARIQAAVVAPEGTVLAANAAFAERAAGDPAARVADAEFVSFLRQDEEERIYYAREGGRGAPLRLLHIPLTAAEAGGDLADSGETASLMVLIEAGAGAGEGRANLPLFEALLARLPLGLAMTDRDGRFLFANPAFHRAAGRADQDLPHHPADLVVREDKGALVDAVRRHALGSPAAGDIAVRLRSAPSEPVTVSLAPVRGLGDAAVLLSLKDSTEEARLKRQIGQATKMQAVGQLAGGVAHDFNNVLTAIIGHCDLMLLRHTPGDSDYDDIQQIKANSNRAASLTRQLLAFSRQQTLRPQVLQLPDVVSEVSHMLRRLLGEKIRLEVSHARDLAPVRADPGQLEQVIVNLAVNARDAILARPGGDGGGKLSIRTFPVSAAEVRAMKTDVMPVGAYTALAVEDTGCGIPADVLGKIFEPFFTTKESGKGTGLGLSTAYGVIKQSGGFIFADSERGKGARFTIYLPAYQGGDGEDPAGEAAAPVAPAPVKWSGGGRVLLVEDEDTVRTVVERALTRAGYEVTVARHGEDGVEAVARGERFDLVVSDVAMPGLDGPAMARAVRRFCPDLPLLFISGYAEEQLRRDIDLPRVHFLAKPFSVRQISEAVEGVLRGTPPGA